jgi:hypothetical protein
MRKGFLIYREMRQYLVYEERPLVIYDFVTASFGISLYMREIFFSFLSVYKKPGGSHDPGLFGRGTVL